MIPDTLKAKLDAKLIEAGFTGHIEYSESEDPMTFNKCIGMSYVEEGKEPRTLYARFTIETALLIKEHHEIDLATEIANAFIQEIILELQLEAGAFK